MTNSLTGTTRTLLDAILDQLIPANPEREISAAGAAGVGEFIDSNRVAHSSVAAGIDDLLSYAQSLEGDITADRVRQLEAEKPESFEMLLRLTYMGYYSRPDNRSVVGVAAWPVHPKGYDVASESSALLDELTAPVRARGSIYRTV